MRRIAVALAAACSAPAEPVPAPIRVPRTPPAVTHEPIDVISVLAAAPVETGAIVIGPAQLHLAGVQLDPRETGAVHDVDVFETRGNDVRVGIRFNGVRFAVWTTRSQLLGVLTRKHSIGEAVHLEPGVRVHTLGRKNGRTQFRYIGAIEIEGSIPDDALAERGPARRRLVRQASGATKQLFIAGAVIRSEPRTHAPVLGHLHHSIALDVVQHVDNAWHEIAYKDTDIFVRGFISRLAPPGRIHRRPDEEPLPLVTTNATVPPNTCLFADGEPIGFTDATVAVHLAPARPNWFTLTVDTPWGHTAFEAKGPIESQLATCP